MADIDPVVRQMILCDDVVPNARSPLKHDTCGLIHSVIADTPGQLPVVLPVLCVYLQLTGGRGTGAVQVVATEADTGDPVFASPAYTVTYPPDPLLVVPLMIRILNCRFPRTGLYWIEFRHSGRELMRQPVGVR